MNQQDKKESSLIVKGFEPRTKLHSYILTINLTENLDSIKTKIGLALGFHLGNASFYTVGYKFQQKVENVNSLSDFCGDQSGIAQLQFFLNYDQDNMPNRVYLLKIFRIIDDKEVVLSNFEKQQKQICTTKWVISPDFKELRSTLAMPDDPMDWSVGDVEVWLQWCKHEFNLNFLNWRNNSLDGRTLFNFSVSQFKQFVPYDPENLFHMHFELLRKTHIVASPVSIDDAVSPTIPNSPNSLSKEDKNQLNCTTKSSKDLTNSSEKDIIKFKSSNIQLWQFLLELLTDPEFTDIICWCGERGEFLFKQPEEVAKLWGAQKGKSNMTYGKLARSLRYYYCSENALFTKMVGRKFSYKFELDLRQVLGYSPTELMQQMSHVANTS